MRPLCGVLAFFVCLAVTGQAQERSVPSGSGTISGRIVTSASEPVRDVTVALGLALDNDPLKWQAWWAGSTDADGVYQFQDLPPGRFTVIAVKNGFAGWKSVPSSAPAPIAASRQAPAIALATTASRITIELTPGGHASDVNLTLYRPSTLSGRALGSDGAPAANVPVMLYTPNDAGAIVSSRGSRPTDANGAYAIDDVRPGTYYIGSSQQARLQDVDLGTLIEVTIAEGVSMPNIDVPVFGDRAITIKGHITDASGRVPRMTQFEYGTPGATHRGLLSSVGSDGSFTIVDRGLRPGPVTLIVRGDSEDGPVVALRTVAIADGPNEVDVLLGTPGEIRGRVSIQGGVPLTTVSAMVALVRKGFQPLGDSDRIIDIAPDGWFEATDVIGAYELRIDAPARWTVTSVRRRGMRVANDTLVVGDGETLDDIEIVIGPPARAR